MICTSLPRQTNVVDFDFANVVGGVEHCHFHMLLRAFWRKKRKGGKIGMVRFYWFVPTTSIGRTFLLKGISTVVVRREKKSKHCNFFIQNEDAHVIRK